MWEKSLAKWFIYMLGYCWKKSFKQDSAEKTP